MNAERVHKLVISVASWFLTICRQKVGPARGQIPGDVRHDDGYGIRTIIQSEVEIGVRNLFEARSARRLLASKALVVAAMNSAVRSIWCPLLFGCAWQQTIFRRVAGSAIARPKCHYTLAFRRVFPPRLFRRTFHVPNRSNECVQHARVVVLVGDSAQIVVHRIWVTPRQLRGSSDSQLAQIGSDRRADVRNVFQVSDLSHSPGRFFSPMDHR